MRHFVLHGDTLYCSEDNMLQSMHFALQWGRTLHVTGDPIGGQGAWEVVRRMIQLGRCQAMAAMGHALYHYGRRIGGLGRMKSLTCTHHP